MDIPNNRIDIPNNDNLYPDIEITNTPTLEGEGNNINPLPAEIRG
jgi:hypothetical protein